MSQIDFVRIAEAALSRARELLPEWLPGGRIIGREYVCGNLRGEPGESLKVNLETGKWCDFSEGHKGGDLTSLYAAIEGVGQGEAAKRLASRLGTADTSSPPDTTLRPGKRPAPQTPQSPEPLDLTPPPSDAAAPDFISHFGAPVETWAYLDAAEKILFHVARYEPRGQRKQFVPWSWSRTQSKWVLKSWPAPRPLYGLPRLAKHPSKPVLVVEGERAADAAQRIVGSHYVVVTWSGGSSSVARTDWSPIHGRKLLLWPDADKPGIAAMDKLSNALLSDCPEIKILSTSGMPDGFDAADAEGEGWDWEKLINWAKPRVQVAGHTETYTPLLPMDTITIPAAEPEPLTGELIEPEHLRESPPTIMIGGNIEDYCDSNMGRFYPIWGEIGLQTNKAGSPVVNLDTVLLVVERYKPFENLVWYDEFELKLLTTWNSDSKEPREWSKYDTFEVCRVIQRDVGLFRVTDELVSKAVTLYAFKHKRNALKEWLESLKHDGIPRVEPFFHLHMGAERTPHHLKASLNFWVSMVARVYDPGCKVDNMIVLEGGQGKYKSTALDAIGGKWFTEAHDSVTNKDFFMVLHGKLLVEISEMDAFSKAEISTIKKTITNRKDRFRPPYGATAEDFPRQGVFAGTTNESAYLRDHTGGRRFWPVRIGTIDIESIRGDRDQLFAEAVALYKAGQTWWEMPASTAEEQEQRLQSDAWDDDVYAFISRVPDTSLKDVWEKALNGDISRLSRMDELRLGKILHRAGWRSRMVRRFGMLARRWVPGGNEEMN